MSKPVAGTLAMASIVAASMSALIVGSMVTGSSALDCSPTESVVLRSPEAAPASLAPATHKADPTLGLDGSGPRMTCSSPRPTGAPAASSGAEASAAPLPGDGLTIEVEAGDPYFTPKEFSLPATGASRIVLANRGYVGHNLTVDELGIQLVAGRGATDEVVLVDPPPGTYTFYCSVSGHREAGMVGTLTVE